MVDQEHAQILRRMVGQPQEDLADSPLTSSRAVRTALTKVAQDCAGLRVTVQSVDEQVQPLDDVLGDLTDELMLVGLERNGALVGLVAVDMQLRAAVVEMQTVESVAERPVEARPATTTDKRLCDPLLSGLLNALPQAVTGTEFEGWMDSAKPGSMLQSVRAAGLLLQDQAYRVLRVTADLGSGDRDGMIAFVLPVQSQTIQPVETHEVPNDWPGAFRAAVSEAAAVFEAELCKIQMPIGQANTLSIGDIVPLSGCTVASVKLRSLDGQAVRLARLGQSNGHRAVRIVAQEQPDMVELESTVHGSLHMGAGHTPLADDIVDVPVAPLQADAAALSLDPEPTLLPDGEELGAEDFNLPTPQIAVDDLETEGVEPLG
ncbi:MAG: FliM/FliN family flagellar motor switch protein [Pseudomonadota bacterium]